MGRPMVGLVLLLLGIGGWAAMEHGLRASSGQAWYLYGGLAVLSTAAMAFVVLIKGRARRPVAREMPVRPVLPPAYDRPEPARSTGWVCGICGERQEPQFSACWKCGFVRTPPASSGPHPPDETELQADAHGRSGDRSREPDSQPSEQFEFRGLRQDVTNDLATRFILGLLYTVGFLIMTFVTCARGLRF